MVVDTGVTVSCFFFFFFFFEAGKLNSAFVRQMCLERRTRPVRSSDSHWRDAHQTRQLRLAGVSEGVAVLTTVDVREQNHDAKISERLGGLVVTCGPCSQTCGHNSHVFYFLASLSFHQVSLLL